MTEIKIKPDYEKIKELVRKYCTLGSSILALSTATPIYDYISTQEVPENILLGSIILGTIGGAILVKGISTYFTYKSSFVELKPDEKEYRGLSIDDFIQKEGNYRLLTITNSYKKKEHGTIEVELQGYNKNFTKFYERFVIPLVKNPEKVIHNLYSMEKNNLKDVKILKSEF